jgi:hypothetical protein
MGMFDNTYDMSTIPVNSSFSYGDTNAFMIGAYGGAAGMVSSVGKLAGFQDEDDMLEEIYETMDLSTPEGIQAAVDAVMRINPEEGRKLQEQVLASAQSSESTANIKMNTENQLIAHKQKLFGSIYAKDFERDATTVGEGFAIHYFLEKNEIKFDPKKVKTIAQAEAAIKKHMGKDSYYKNTQKQLNTYVLQQRDMYILRRATQDAGVELTGDSTTTTPNKFDTSLTDTSDTVDTSDDMGTQAVPENFNPLTTPEGPDFRAEKNGTMGTWTYVKDWITGTGGMGGYEVKEWKFIPDIGAEYAKEGVKYNIDGVSITNNEMFNNMLDDMAD